MALLVTLAVMLTTFTWSVMLKMLSALTSTEQGIALPRTVSETPIGFVSAYHTAGRNTSRTTDKE
jgi:hypothetical protein